MGVRGVEIGRDEIQAGCSTRYWLDVAVLGLKVSDCLVVLYEGLVFCTRVLVYLDFALEPTGIYYVADPSTAYSVVLVCRSFRWVLVLRLRLNVRRAGLLLSKTRQS
jgi:hypothetical protein